MKLTLKLTLDGLMRALRAHAHRTAERAEAEREVRAWRKRQAGRMGMAARTAERRDDGRGD